jgi:hypothetical protein
MKYLFVLEFQVCLRFPGDVAALQLLSGGIAGILGSREDLPEVEGASAPPTAPQPDI